MERVDYLFGIYNTWDNVGAAPPEQTWGQDLSWSAVIVMMVWYMYRFVGLAQDYGNFIAN